MAKYYLFNHELVDLLKVKKINARIILKKKSQFSVIIEFTTFQFIYTRLVI